MAREIWVPESEMTVTVIDGKVSISETMVMHQIPVGRKPLGINDRTVEEVEPRAMVD